MKRITIADLPCPEKIPGPHSLTFMVTKRCLIDIAHGKPPKMEFLAGYCTTDERVRSILGVVKKVGARRVFEIGTHMGATAANLALSGCVVHTIDLPLPQFREVMQGSLGTMPSDPYIEIGCPRLLANDLQLGITFHEGDTRAWKPGLLAGTFDLVFIDGYHTTEMARNDTALARELLRPGGTIVWDDAGLPAIRVFLQEFEAEHGEVTEVHYSDPIPKESWPIAFWSEAA